ncbi:unnamed protein product [Spodoptera exigua]|nr:unnamed protein product [Spodoptera exigua]
MPLVPQDVRGVSTRAMSEAQRVREEGAAAQTSDAEAKPVQVDLLLQLQQMMAEQARRQEEQARRQEEQARRQEEQARRQEEQARRQEEQARRQEEQARCQAEQLRELKEDQDRRQEDQARRQEEQARRLEEMHRDFTKGLQKAVERVQEVEEGQVLDNGTLVFLPFSAVQYRQDVHATVYRCRAHNAHGAIVSRDMRTQAEGFFLRRTTPPRPRTLLMRKNPSVVRK